MRKIKRLGLLAAVFSLIGSGVPALAQGRPTTLVAPASPSGAHPEAHAPATVQEPGDDHTVVVNGKRHRGLFHRIGHFFSRLIHGKRKWYSTPTHRNHCKSHYKSYNAQTNSYRAYSGVRRVCVI